MPLKHFTETVLVVILGAVTIVTGILIDTLPLLPHGIIPWAILLGATLLYPLMLYPLFRSNRADYFFRVLHFGPAFMVLLWLLIQVVALRDPSFLIIHQWYTWGWTLGGVMIVFALLEVFCLQVLRRRTPRLTFLTLLLVPFAALAVVGEQAMQWDQQISSVVWQGSWWDIAGSGTNVTGGPIALNPSSANLQHSDDPDEEAWREKLRALDERLKSVSSSSAAKSSAAASSTKASSSSAVASSSKSSVVSSARSSSVQSSSVKSSSSKSSSSSKTVIAFQSSSSSSLKPPALASSGPGMIVVGVTMLAGYCGTLHRRWKLRTSDTGHGTSGTI